MVDLEFGKIKVLGSWPGIVTYYLYSIQQLFIKGPLGTKSKGHKVEYNTSFQSLYILMHGSSKESPWAVAKLIRCWAFM